MGAGKRHEQLELVVDAEAYRIQRGGLFTGWQLWVKRDLPMYILLGAPTLG